MAARPAAPRGAAPLLRRLAGVVAAGCLLLGVAGPARAAPCPSPSLLAFPATGAIELHVKQGPRFGDSLFYERPLLVAPGRYQDFACGSIGAWSTPAGEVIFSVAEDAVPDTEQHLAELQVEWDGPEHFDAFVLLWTRDDPKAYAQDLVVNEPGQRGAVRLKLPYPDSYAFRMQGCRTGSGCTWLFPAPFWINVAPFVLPPPLPSPIPPPLLPGELNAHEPHDGERLTPAQLKALRDRICGGHGKLHGEGDHAGELEPLKALAMLQVVRDEAPSYVGCPDFLTWAKIKDQVNEAIVGAKVVSQPGTDLSKATRVLAAVLPALLLSLLGAVLFAALTGGFWAGVVGAATGAAIGTLLGIVNFDKPGDYDMRLQGILQIAYRFDKQLTPEARCHVLGSLLTVHGGADQVEEFLDLNWVPTPILETENHVLMIQSARYLTNRLYGQWKTSCPEVKDPGDTDNDANGMTDWWLDRLHLLLKRDFYEFSARPYAELSMEAVRNLAEFGAHPNPAVCQHAKDSALPPAVARACDVRRAARNVLDYQAARFALSADTLRRAAPFRRHMDNRGYARLLGRNADPGTPLNLVYAADSPSVRKHGGRLNEGFVNTMLSPAQSDYGPPYLVTDLLSDLSKAPYGAGPAAPVRWLQRLRVTQRDTSTPEIYYRESKFLISAGGRFDGGVGAAALWFTHDEDAWPLPTTLMPTAEGTDLRHLLRIQGAWEQDSRVNLCVSHGFACGLNPIIPAGIPKACQVQKGEWTFLDFKASSPGCTLDFGFFAAVLRRPCGPNVNDLCKGDDKPDDDEDHTDYDAQPPPGFAFGLFEATEYDRPFASYIADVLAKNPTGSFNFDGENVFRSPNGRVVKFLFRESEGRYPIVSVAEGGSTTALAIEPAIKHWPTAAAEPTLAGGEINSSEQFPGCVIVDNTRMGQRLILDLSDARHPRRTRVLLPTECRCPVTPECQPKRLE